MKRATAFWTCSLLVPAVALPIATTTSCSQTWGYKTPISIGSTIKGSDLDPYRDFKSQTDLVDLNGDPIVNCLQSNFAMDIAHGANYAYSLPQKWDGSKEVASETLPATGETITWNKGAFVDGSAAWYSQSSGDFTNGVIRTGTKKDGSGAVTANVNESIMSYKNNIQSTNIELVASIANSINQLFNYTLQYQGSQIGTGYTQSTETDTDLAVAWGQNLTHGEQSSVQNRQFYESIFASNAVSGTGTPEAMLRPSHVEFNFVDFPIPAYKKDGSEITGVSDATKELLNGQVIRPSKTGDAALSPAYWSSKSAEQTETTYNFRTAAKVGTKEERKYIVYSYTNVPVIVKFNTFGKKYLNPRINSGFLVTDFYSSDKSIKDAIGNSWSGTIDKFATPDSTPQYNGFMFYAPEGNKAQITPKYTVKENQDYRIWKSTSECRLQQNDFVVLLNYAYKECTSVKIGDAEAQTDEKTCSPYDTVTMTGFNTIFPGYICDANVAPSTENTLFVALNNGKSHPGYTFDINKVNAYTNNLLQLVKRSSSEGMKPHAKDLTNESKSLLKFLAYMLGDNTLAVDTVNCIDTLDIK